MAREATEAVVADADGPPAAPALKYCCRCGGGGGDPCRHG